MNNQKAKKHKVQITVIGAGIAGITTAFHLGKKGYDVNLIDPKINSEINNLKPNNGTQAALGALMGNIYKRSKGKGFLIRNQSMQLWKEWLTQIDNHGSKLNLKKPLIKLACSEKEYQSMIEISKNKKEYGIELLDQSSIDIWSSIFEKNLIGGLVSHEDGRLNPIKLLQSLISSLDKIKVNKIEDNVIKINKNYNSSTQNWGIYLERNPKINQDYIVICSALNSQKLLKNLGHSIFLEPILGQVIELEIENKAINQYQWPAILNYQSINFIHQHPNHIIMGATLEKGITPNLLNRQAMLKMENNAPKWLRKATVKNEWNGIRARPINETSPLLKCLEPGLLINTGHYRNGILLAPSCAEWVGFKIDGQ